MKYIYPDLGWYTGLSEQKSVEPRCPFANVHCCYRYYVSLYLLGDANITTKMKCDKIKKLETLWKNSDLLPAVAEHDTGISISDGKNTGFCNFCPEISFDVFGLFAVSLYKYTDEIDIQVSHKMLEKETFSDDWRWDWASVVPQHYLSCPTYSQLSLKHDLPADPLLVNNHGPNLIEVKPSFMGISINLRLLFTHFVKWGFSKWR